MSNADLTQYNGSQAFPASADVGTNADQYLVPTDGKLITALSNIINEAPVNVALHRLKDYVLGLRGAIIGDFALANRKTLHSVLVDANGGTASALSGGYVQSLYGYLAGAVGAIQASLSPAQLSFTSTVASGSNPAGTAAAANTLDALMIPKAWIRWETNGVGGITYDDGGRLRPFRERAFQRAFQSCGAASFREIHLRAAASSLARVRLDRHCCRGR